MIAMRMKGQLRLQLADTRSGAIVDLPAKMNMITNYGMNAIESNPICDLFRYCAAGDGSRQTKIQASGTGSAAGGTFTATDNTFVIGDVGNHIKMTSGIDANKILEITGFTSATQVSVDTTASTGSFQIYRTNEAGLDNETDRTGRMVYGECSSTYASGEMTHIRKFELPLQTVREGKQYQEFGFSASSAPGSNLFAKVVLDEPLNIAYGKKLLAIYSLKVSLTPGPTATRTGGSVPNITGWPLTVVGVPNPSLSGTERLQGLQLSRVDHAGRTISRRNAIEPSGEAYFAMCTTATTHGSTFPYDEGANPVGLLATKVASNSSGAGYSVSKSVTFDPGEGALDELNENYIREVSLGSAPLGEDSYKIAIAYAFDYPQTKEDAPGTSLDLVYTVAWDREFN